MSKKILEPIIIKSEKTLQIFFNPTLSYDPTKLNTDITSIDRTSIENYTLSLTEASDFLHIPNYFPKNFANLKKIKIRINRIGYSESSEKNVGELLKSLFSNLKNSKFLESFTLDLNLTSKKICENAVEMLQESELCLDKLSKFKLNLSQIEDKVDLSPLKNILIKCTKLKKLGLDFSGNRKVKGLKEILEKVIRMEELEVLKLNLFNCDVENIIITDIICKMDSLTFLKIVRKNII